MGLRRNAVIESPPPFDIERERDKRRERVLAADKNLSIAVEALRTFQGEHFSVNASGQLVPRVTADLVPIEMVDREHQRLVRNISACHDEFQKALKEWNAL